MLALFRHKGGGDPVAERQNDLTNWKNEKGDSGKPISCLELKPSLSTLTNEKHEGYFLDIDGEIHFLVLN